MIPPDWLRRVLAAIRPLLPREFIGSFEVHVFKGGIGNVNVRQSYKENSGDADPPPVVDSRRT